MAAIYRDYGELMRRRCRVITRNDALAEDALQESFVNLIRYGAGFREANAPLRWLYRLVDRCCFQQLDRVKRREEKEGELQEPVVPHISMRLEHRDTVLRLLSSLPDDLRAVAVLAFVDGLSQGEIGAELGWSRQTINKKLQQVRQRAQEFAGNSSAPSAPGDG